MEQRRSQRHGQDLHSVNAGDVSSCWVCYILRLLFLFLVGQGLRRHCKRPFRSAMSRGQLCRIDTRPAGGLRKAETGLRCRRRVIGWLVVVVYERGE
ncbi:unnamed protein product [Boreogadus saida]